jgi:predicted  nucleic acid-binding Zn-ribbon protein
MAHVLDERLVPPQVQTVKKLARLDAEIAASSRIGRGGPLHLDSARRACLQALPQSFLDAYFALVRQRNVPAVVIASRLVCGGCRGALEADIDERLRLGAIESCPRCDRLLVTAS